MKMSFIRELSTKYFDSTFLIRETANSEPIACTPRRYPEDPEDYRPEFDEYLTVSCILLYKNGEIKKRKLDLSSYIIDSFIPEAGFYNVDKTVIYVHNSFAKQWKRAGKEHNTLIPIFHNANIRQLRKTRTYTDYIYLSLLNGRFMPVTEAIHSIEQGFRALSAFSEQYCVGLFTEAENVIAIYFKDKIIGVLDKEKDQYIIRLPEKGKMFEEDLEQYLPVKIIK